MKSIKKTLSLWPNEIVFERNWKAVVVALFLSSTSRIAAAESTVTYYYTDSQGTVIAATDASGNIVRRSDFAPYGRRVLGPDESGPGYTGHVGDADVGLVYMQARYFDPEASRFMSVDPAEIEPGDIFSFNRMVYAHDNPLRYVDPDGRQSCDYCNQTVGPGVYVGASMLGAGNARAAYESRVSTLGPSDSAERATIKSETRQQTPSMFRRSIEAVRPSVNAKPGSGARANITNARVNAIGAAGRVAGSVMVIAGIGTGVLEVATSDNPTRSLAVVGGGLLGAAIGGNAGAAGGTAVGGAVAGPPGAVVGAFTGGVAGSTAGAVAGREAGGKLYDTIYPE